MASSMLSVVAQLRDTQEKLRTTETRCQILEDENRKLRQLLSGLAGMPPDQVRKAISEFDVGLSSAGSTALALGATDGSASGTAQSTSAIGVPADVASLRSQLAESRAMQVREIDQHDALIKELRGQLQDLTRRNAQLELTLHDNATAMRRQYETHIEQLELELRRSRGGASMLVNGQPAGATNQQPPLAAASSPRPLPSAGAPTSNAMRPYRGAGESGGAAASSGGFGMQYVAQTAPTALSPTQSIASRGLTASGAMVGGATYASPAASSAAGQFSSSAKVTGNMYSPQQPPPPGMMVNLPYGATSFGSPGGGASGGRTPETRRNLL